MLWFVLLLVVEDGLSLVSGSILVVVVILGLLRSMLGIMAWWLLPLNLSLVFFFVMKGLCGRGSWFNGWGCHVREARRSDNIGIRLRGGR